MKILVTGGSGFLGKKIIEDLTKKKIKTLVLGRNSIIENNYTSFIKFDFKKNTIDDSLLYHINSCNKLLHLAWEGLPNYFENIHYTNNLFYQYKFLKDIIINTKINDLTISGTCLEYGLIEGELETNLDTKPIVPYAIAKDFLRKLLFILKDNYDFNLKWARIFYLYGKNEKKNSLLSQIDQSIKKNEESFNMSKGDQVRDFIEVSEASEFFLKLLNLDDSGIFNCSSGIPITVKEFVLNYLKKKNYNLKLNLGFYPYNEYEPHKFWGKKEYF